MNKSTQQYQYRIITIRQYCIRMGNVSPRITSVTVIPSLSGLVTTITINQHISKNNNNTVTSTSSTIGVKTTIRNRGQLSSSVAEVIRLPSSSTAIVNNNNQQWQYSINADNSHRQNNNNTNRWSSSTVSSTAMCGIERNTEQRQNNQRGSSKFSSEQIINHNES